MVYIYLHSCCILTSIASRSNPRPSSMAVIKAATTIPTSPITTVIDARRGAVRSTHPKWTHYSVGCTNVISLGLHHGGVPAKERHNTLVQ